MTEIEVARIVGVPNSLMMATIVWQTLRTCKQMQQVLKTSTANLEISVAPEPAYRKELYELVERMEKRKHV